MIMEDYFLIAILAVPMFAGIIASAISIADDFNHINN